MPPADGRDVMGQGARGRRWVVRACAVLLLVCMGLGPDGASAHRAVDAGTLAANGLVIPSLTHGEMAVVARHAGAIRALAGSQQRTDPTFRRLANFAALQRTYCFWGLVPGSLTDEDNPFNTCLHAYLGALRALLVHMQEMPGESGEARVLVGRIEQEMVASEAASSLCRSSGADFNTAALIVPEWRDVLGYPPTLLTFAGLALMVAAGAWGVFGIRTPPPRRHG